MQPEPSPGEPRDTDLLAASSDAVSGRRVVGGRRLPGMAPRRSELQRSGDYSGPSAFSCRLSPAGSPFSVVPRQYRAPGGRPPARSRRDATRRGHQPRRAARDPRRRGFGQDARAHPPHRLAVARGHHRSAPRPRAHVHAQGRRRAPHPARPGSASTMRSPPARSTRSRSRSCVAAPTTSSARCPRCSNARCGCSCRSSTSAAAKPGCAPPSSPPRSSGRRRGSCAPTGTRRRSRSPARTPRARPPKSPTSTASTSARSAPGPRRLRRPHPGCADVLERDAEFAAAQRWRFRHLFVDEFQDASPAQFRLLRAWLGDRSELCVVGDADQAIYGFAGADPTYLVRFTAQFPPERFPDVGVVRLGGNYRSTPAGRGGGGRGARLLAPPHRGAGGAARRPRSRRHRVRHRRRRSAQRRRARCAPRTIGCALVAHRRPLPGERAVGALRGGVPPRRRAVPCPWRRAVPGAARGQGRARRAAGVGAHGAEPRLRRAPHRSRRRPTTSRPRSGASTSTRSCASATSTSMPRAARELAPWQAGSVDGFLAFLQTALRGDDGGLAGTTRSSSSRSTGRRGSSGTPCSSPASSAGWCRSRTPRPPRRSTRSSASSTSR